jgi:hypothetical protein
MTHPPTTTLSTSKGEDYEDAKSNSVDGSDGGGSCKNSDGKAGGMLPFRRLLRIL